MTAFNDLIDVADLQVLIESPACIVVDCRFNLTQPDSGRQEYLAGHIPGAVYAHLDNDLASPVRPASGRHPLPEVETFVHTLGNWGISNDTQVVAYDHANGSVAARLWWLLKWLGHDKVAVLNGGFAAWSSAGEAISAEVTKVSPTTFVAEVDADMVATTREIAAALTEGKAINLIDARDPPRYGGKVEPIDAVAGHIPGALNMPFLGGVFGDGTWRSALDHREAWQNVLAGRPEAPPIVMCGSGVTACHLLISACLAGRPMPRLYVGSWSEWIRDDSRPVARQK